MAHSFCKIYIHVIFSTKERQRWLDDTIRGRVHAYMATLLRDAGCPFAVVGGPDDHVHFLADIGKKILPVDMIAKVKQDSSKFIKTLGAEYYDFFGKPGTACFRLGQPMSTKSGHILLGKSSTIASRHFKRSFVPSSYGTVYIMTNGMSGDKI